MSNLDILPFDHTFLDSDEVVFGYFNQAKAEHIPPRLLRLNKGKFFDKWTNGAVLHLPKVNVSAVRDKIFTHPILIYLIIRNLPKRRKCLQGRLVTERLDGRVVDDPISLFEASQWCAFTVPQLHDALLYAVLDMIFAGDANPIFHTTIVLRFDMMCVRRN